MNKYSLSHIVAFCVLCVLSACSTTNGVPEGDQLYTGLTHVKYNNYTPCDHATDIQAEIDAALACALYSARTDIALKPDTAVFGELTLAGEIRPVRKEKQRIKAAQNLGFTNVVGPDKEEGAVKAEGIRELVKILFK